MKQIAILTSLLAAPLLCLGQISAPIKKVTLDQTEKKEILAELAKAGVIQQNLKRGEGKALDVSNQTNGKASDMPKANPNKKGPGEGGGGNSIVASQVSEEKFLDRYESENSVPTTFDRLAKEVPLLDQRLKSFEKTAVGLRLLMYQSPARSKRWVLTKLPLARNEDCVNSLLYVVKTRVVACQTKEYVRVDANWYNAVPKIDRAWMLSHELLVGYMMKIQSSDEVALRTFNAAVMSVDKNGDADRWEGDHSRQDFNKITGLGFGQYDQYLEIKAKLEDLLPRFCELAKGGFDNPEESLNKIAKIKEDQIDASNMTTEEKKAAIRDAYRNMFSEHNKYLDRVNAATHLTYEMPPIRYDGELVQIASDFKIHLVPRYVERSADIILEMLDRSQSASKRMYVKNINYLKEFSSSLQGKFGCE